MGRHGEEAEETESVHAVQGIRRPTAVKPAEFGCVRQCNESPERVSQFPDLAALRGEPLSAPASKRPRLLLGNGLARPALDLIVASASSAG